MKKVILSAILAMSLLLTGSVAVYASDVMPLAAPENVLDGCSDGYGFTEAWEVSISEGDAHLTYGFNTFLVDEDYAWSVHDSTAHNAAIKNGDGWHLPTLPSLPTFTSKVEVEHSGTHVYYACEY